MPFLKVDEATTPQTRNEVRRKSRKSWSYDPARTANFASRDGPLQNQLSNEHISSSELFTIAIAYALDGRYKEEVQSLYQCAASGYLPAQAIYSQIYSGRVSLGQLVEADVHPAVDEWITAAVESGYLFPAPGTLQTGTKSFKQAWDQFRRSGGYNIHYCSGEDRGSENGLQDGSNTGLFGRLDEDLEGLDLHLAAAMDDLQPGVLSFLLDIPNAINSKDRWGDTPLMKCCMAGHIRSLRALIKAGADANLINEISQVSPLHWLFVFPEENVEEACSLLQSGGADFRHPKNASGFESFHFPFAWPSGGPLHWAVFSGRAKAAEALIRHGMDTKTRDVSGQTALHIALKMTNVPMIRLLFELGIDLKLHTVIEEESYLSGGLYRDPRRSALHDFVTSPLELGADEEFEDFDPGLIYIPPQYDAIILNDDSNLERTRETFRAVLTYEPNCLWWKDSKGFTVLHHALSTTKYDEQTFGLIIENSPPADDVHVGDVSVSEYAFCPTFLWEHNRKHFDNLDLQYSIRLGQLLKPLTSRRRSCFVNRWEPLVPQNTTLWSRVDRSHFQCSRYLRHF